MPPFDLDAVVYEDSASITVLILSDCCILIRLLPGPKLLPGVEKADVNGRDAKDIGVDGEKMR